MKQYLDLLKLVLDKGTVSTDRTGTGTISYFSPPDLDFDLSKGFPLVTTKKVFTRGIIEELLWFLRGSTNNTELAAKGVHIWDAWADPQGNLGPVYGAQWRDWGGKDVQAKDHATGAVLSHHIPGIDQISNLIQGIKNDPASRRHIVSAWNVADLPSMALAPCHCFFQVYVRNGSLDLKMYQRSADLFLGVPFNIASYALLTHMLAAQTGLKPGRFIHSFGDAHIYLNHIDQVKQQLERTPFDLPTLYLNQDVQTIFSYTIDDIDILRYQSHPAIKGEVAV